MKKVWVLYEDHSCEYEGCSPPMGVFTTKKKAQEFVRRMNKTAGYKLYDSVEYARFEADERVGESFSENGDA